MHIYSVCLYVHTYVCMNVCIFLNINWAVCVMLVMYISIGLTIWYWTPIAVLLPSKTIFPFASIPQLSIVLV